MIIGTGEGRVNACKIIFTIFRLPADPPMVMAFILAECIIIVFEVVF
jgi:hypothetical protein